MGYPLEGIIGGVSNNTSLTFLKEGIHATKLYMFAIIV
tara:strand:+ start:871 stop:984 length:114 start_codon:yes stop_codon:yes gene_type:complete